MSTGRLEAFSDGVLAIIITVMVLELKPPDGADFSDLRSSATSLLTYLLSFVYIGIYWNNHHHLFQICKSVDGTVLWANLHLLFWLSLYPFTTAWMDEHFGRASTVVYGVNLLLAAIAFTILQRRMTRMPESRERMAEVFGADRKGKASPVLYALGIALAFVQPWLGLVPFVVVALLWLVPDPRIERYLQRQRELGNAVD
ncbi:TMEM175 family protein [Nocardioides cynanchi]|uniref:TMEM175 family protein n=1 Tax=Nocardioides cynanchi TaxID=2558918 RepID=UPI0012444EFC|nr:TMEM175 family protein [Nocardioides cynanchi]